MLKSFKGHIETYSCMVEQLIVLWVEVRLGLFSLSCSNLHKFLIGNTRILLTQLSSFLARHNTEINRDICNKYEEIAKRLEEVGVM